MDGLIKDEDKAIILLNELPRSYDQLKDAMLYGRILTISTDEVVFALKTKELQKTSDNCNGNLGDSLVTKQRFTKKMNYKKNMTKNTAKKGKNVNYTNKEDMKCFHCTKPSHHKKDCYL